MAELSKTTSKSRYKIIPIVAGYCSGEKKSEVCEKLEQITLHWHCSHPQAW